MSSTNGTRGDADSNVRTNAVSEQELFAKLARTPAQRLEEALDELDHLAQSQAPTLDDYRLRRARTAAVVAVDRLEAELQAARRRVLHEAKQLDARDDRLRAMRGLTPGIVAVSDSFSRWTLNEIRVRRTELGLDQEHGHPLAVAIDSDCCGVA